MISRLHSIHIELAKQRIDQRGHAFDRIDKHAADAALVKLGRLQDIAVAGSQFGCITKLDLQTSIILASCALRRKRPLQLTHDLILPVGKSGFQLVLGDDGNAARCDRSAYSRPVIRRLGLENQLCADWQIHCRDIERVLDDAAVAEASGARAIRAGNRFGPAEELDAMLLSRG
jgi:hypothetical protein